MDDGAKLSSGTPKQLQRSKLRTSAAQVCTSKHFFYAVRLLERYKSNPNLDHWRAGKKILSYLQGTKDYMLMYERDDELELVGYSDADFAGCIDSRKFISEYVFMMAGGAVS